MVSNDCAQSGDKMSNSGNKHRSSSRLPTFNKETTPFLPSAPRFKRLKVVCVPISVEVRAGVWSLWEGVFVSLRRCNQSVWLRVPGYGGRTRGQKHWGNSMRWRCMTFGRGRHKGAGSKTRNSGKSSLPQADTGLPLTITGTLRDAAA